MRIETDSYYKIGHSHIFCQDYARHGVVESRGRKYHYSLVSDGCSGSPDTDIGARILASIFPVALKSVLNQTNLTEKSLEDSIVEWLYVHSLPIAYNSIDATLLAIVYDEIEDEVHTFAWGDGTIVYKMKDGTVTLENISYPTGAPYYLSYRKHQDRIEAYEKQFGYEYSNVEFGLVTGNNYIYFPERDLQKIKSWSSTFQNASKSLDFVSVHSDGFGTFSSNVPIARHVLWNEVLSFKSLEGEFVRRRMRAFNRLCEKSGWKHSDDISIGSVAFIS